MLLCDRPHVGVVDFRTAQFVVGRERGIDYGDSQGVHHLDRGDAVPPDALDVEALRCLYEPPVRAIETREFARASPDLREACARRGVDLGEEICEEAADAHSAAPATVSVAAQPAHKTRRDPKDLEFLNRKQLSDLAYKAGLNSNGSAEQLRARLAAHLA